MPRILFLAHRLPYPPNKGEKIRAWHILRHLSDRATVDLAAFVDDPADWQYRDALAGVCDAVSLVGLNPRLAKLRGMAGLLSREALSLRYFRSATLARFLEERLAAVRYDLVYAYCSAMGAYLPFPGPDRPPVVVDFVDMDSQKWAQYAEASRGPMAWLYRREARLVAQAEGLLAATCDAGLFATEEEADLFRGRWPQLAGKVHAVHNGVDTDRFDPAHKGPDPYPPGGPVLVFTGVMDYRPNVEAVTWFADAVLPRLRERHPTVRFCIAGARPAADVQALARRPGIIVTGTQPDLRPYLGHAALAVAPLRVGRGIQNKVLEAMSMGLPVVASPEAFRGVEAVAGRDLLVADGAQAWVEQLGRLLDDPTRRATLGDAARVQMLRRYAWPARLSTLDRVLDRVGCPLSDEGARLWAAGAVA